MRIIFTTAMCITYLIASVTVNAQEEKQAFTPTGKPFAKVFWNYHYAMTQNVNQASAFQLKRSYFGYKYALSEKISTKVTFDVGSNGAGSAYTAYLKTAQLDWKVADPIKLSLGLIGLKQYNDQEHLWGYRYIYKSFADEHGFGSSADLGANAEIKLHKKVKLNVLMVNGGGYKKVQDDYGQYRFGGNLVTEPVKGLTLKVYYDMMGNKFDKYDNDSVIADTATISNLAFFAGYKTDKFRFGAEYNMLNNGTKYSNVAENQDLSGMSFYGTYIINKTFEVFARYDQLNSNKLKGATDPWNNSKNGSAIISGIQYKPVKGLSIALNYQSWQYNDTNKDNKNLVYLNFKYKF